MFVFSHLPFRRLWTVLAIVLSALVIVNSSIYFGSGPEASFLLEKGALRTLPLWRAAFYFHVVGASVCLAAGAPLMFTRLLKWPRLHRVLGITYVNSVLFVAGPSALVLATVAKGGLPGVIAFTLAGLAWWWTTLAGYRAIKAGDLPRHLRGMVRSYSLALSAPIFRVFQIGFFYVGLDHDVNYVVSLWLSLAASVWLAESCIHHQTRPARRRATVPQGEYA